MTELRDELAERLGINEHVPNPDALLEDLQRQLAAIAPEVRAEDPEALAGLARIEEAIDAEYKRRELDKLAEKELARRGAADAARQRNERLAELTVRRDELAAGRDQRLWQVECAIDELLYAIATWAEGEMDHEQLRVSIKSMEYEALGIHDAPRESLAWRATVEHRLAYQLKQIGFRDLDFVLPVRPVPGQPDQHRMSGSEPIGKPPVTPCAICKHEKADEITSSVLAREETGESLRAIAERFGVPRTTLGRHAAHVMGPLVVE